MFFIDAVKLLEMCIENKILYGENGLVAIYRHSGSNPNEYPEGWYMDRCDDVARELMNDPEGQRTLAAALQSIGVIFQEQGPSMLNRIQ